LLSDYREVETWTETNLERLPNQETDQIEYKSSQINPGKLSMDGTLANAIAKAASAFWNTGGGILVAGVDDNGQPDGGIDPRIGKQSIRDWIDQIITGVIPHGKYAVGVVAGPATVLRIDPERSVVAIAFAESFSAPHMAPDGRYYVRLGTHTQVANHFIVESLRSSAKPLLAVTSKLKARLPDRGRPHAIHLGIDIVLRNIGGAIAEFPCVTVAKPIGAKAIQQESHLGSSALPKGVAPLGWWRRAAGRSDHVLYPGDEHVVGMLTVYIDRSKQEPDAPPIQCEWITATANGPPNSGVLEIPFLEIWKAVNEVY
jgi:hypothetical protein